MKGELRNSARKRLENIKMNGNNKNYEKRIKLSFTPNMIIYTVCFQISVQFLLVKIKGSAIDYFCCVLTNNLSITFKLGKKHFRRLDIC